MKFIIKNFQSIAYQELDLGGFTILVGSSNLGKSATVRALRALLYNEFDKSFIKSGEHTTELELILSSSNSLQIKSIKLKRSYEKGINSYSITYENGLEENFEKVGTESPDIVKLLGYKYLEVERTSSKINLNFQSQLEGLFLFNSSDVEVSSFFNKIFNIEKYENALRNCNSDIVNFSKSYNKLHKEISLLESEHKSSQEHLKLSKEKYEKVKEVYDSYQKLLKIKDQSSTFFKLKSEVASLYDYLDSSKILSSKISRIKKAITSVYQKTLIRISNDSITIYNSSYKNNNQTKLLLNSFLNHLPSIITISQLKAKFNHKTSLSSLLPNISYLFSNIRLCKKLIDYSSISTSLSHTQTSSIEIINTISQITKNQLQMQSVKKLLTNQYLYRSISISNNKLIALFEIKPIFISYSDYIKQNLIENKRICLTCNSVG